MSGFVYLIAEGVHDVAFVGKLLSVVHGARRIRKLEELDDTLRAWVGSAFKWPRFTGKHHDIERLAVPAPVFYRLPDNAVVVLRNAQGIGEIGRTLEIDIEAFTRIQNGPQTIGVVLDSDDEPAAVRFHELVLTLRGVKLEAPASFGEIAAAAPRVGVFALPEPGMAGTLEDILLLLGNVAYPELSAAAGVYAEFWRKKAEGEPDVADWKELRKPAGAKKATVGAMTAVLKPGRSTQVSLEDQRWVSDATRALPGLQPCLRFLDALLAAAHVVPTAPIAPVAPATSVAAPESQP